MYGSTPLLTCTRKSVVICNGGLDTAGSLDDGASRGSRPRNGSRNGSRGGGFVRPSMGMHNGVRHRGSSRGGMARGAGRLGPAGYAMGGASGRGRGGRGVQRLSATEAAAGLNMLLHAGGFDAAPGEDPYPVRARYLAPALYSRNCILVAPGTPSYVFKDMAASIPYLQ